MAIREEKDRFGEQTPLIAGRETNIGGNKKRERFARLVLTACIQFYTLNNFRKNHCSTKKIGKCASVITKLLILASFFGVNGVSIWLNTFEFRILTQIDNNTATIQESTSKILITVITSFFVFFISFISLIYLYFNPAIIKEFERKSTFTFDKSKLCLFGFIPIIMFAGGIQDISIFLAYLAILTKKITSSVPQSIIILAMSTPIITIYFFLWHTALYVMCVIICSVCDQLYYETFSEIEEAKKFILDKNNINKRGIWKESPLPRYFQFSKRVLVAAKPFRHISCLNILLVFIIFVVISVNRAQQLKWEDKRLDDFPSIYWILFLFFHHSFSVLVMISSISNLNTALTLYSDTILSDIEVQKVLIETNEKNQDFFSRIREEIQLISSSKVRFTISFFGDLSSGVLNSIFLLVIPLMISGMFTV